MSNGGNPPSFAAEQMPTRKRPPSLQRQGSNNNILKYIEGNAPPTTKEYFQAQTVKIARFFGFTSPHKNATETSDHPSPSVSRDNSLRGDEIMLNELYGSAGVIALFRAVESGRTKLVKDLLDKAGDAKVVQKIIINARDPVTRDTLLIRAAQFGLTETCELLCTMGADVSLVNMNGSTALHEAAGVGCEPMVTYLLNLVTDPRFSLIKNDHGQTPFLCAAVHGNVHGDVRCMQAIIDYTTEHNICNRTFLMNQRNNAGMCMVDYVTHQKVINWMEAREVEENILEEKEP